MPKLNWVMKGCGAILLLAATAVALPAQTFTTLHSFNGTDGYEPEGRMIQATNGNFYGTTYQDGAIGYGTVFKITPNGTLTTIYNFCSQPSCADGATPVAGLVLATNGNFYGTTFGGGGANAEGTVFKITPSGTLTTLHSFCPQGPPCTDGANPLAGLIQATNGNFYGTTEVGGASGFGTVFKITPSGTLTTLHSFDFTDGSAPYAGLIQAANGNFYGTTQQGGVSGFGTAFKITAGGTFTVLQNFAGGNGSHPQGDLIQASNGNFYGTTTAGGASNACSNGCGTIFMITPNDTLTILHSFVGTDGQFPYAGLTQATDGNFYGTAEEAGANLHGTVFTITPSGTLTTLHSFDSTDGAYPYAGLLQATNGNFYGTTYQDGANGYGTVFSLSVGLGPFVKTLPASGVVGAAVKILGTKLTGATSVTFNGTAATFTVKSKSEITTTVPTGATTGTVQVITPNGTLSSNVPFTVN
jgi:uncharacterized repeat protein (TIGR03803 family)